MPEQIETLTIASGTSIARGRDSQNLPLVIYILGEISCDDIFQKERRHTKFCFMSGRDDLPSICPASNGMD